MTFPAWTAQRAVSASILKVSADMHPKDLEQPMSNKWTEAYAVFSDHVEKTRQSQFLGIVPQYIVGQFPYRIFADLLPFSKSIRVKPSTPLDFLKFKFQRNKMDAMIVIGSDQQYLGAVTRQSLWETLFKRERDLSAKLRKEIDEKLIAERNLQNVYTSLSENLERQEEIRLAHERQLNTLSKNLLVAEKRQRKELGTELHDHLAQLLAVGRIRVAQASSLTDDTELRKVLQGLDHLFDESLAFTRNLMGELNPSQLPESGLKASLETLVRKMKQYNLIVILKGSETVPCLAENQTFNLYWSIREVLFNIVKHAQVDRAYVTIKKLHERHLKITISDAGKGFSLNEPESLLNPQEDHLGLFLIRERMTAIQGTLTIDSAPGKGTQVNLTVPLFPIDVSS